MLFYVKGGPKGGQAPPGPPTKEFLDLVIKEWETVIKLEEAGKIVGSYGYGDRPGGFSIYNVYSRDELDELLKELPLHSYADFEIVPLIPAEQAIERAKEGKLS